MAAAAPAGADRLTVRRRDQRGASAVELAMLAPALIFLIFFSIQAALYFYGRTVAMQAAREGVSHLRLAQTEDVYRDMKADVVDYVESYAVNVGRETLLDPEAVASYDEVEGRVGMRVTGGVMSLVPGIDLSVTQEAFGPVERFRGDLE